MSYPPMTVVEPNLNLEWSVTPLFCKPLCVTSVDNDLCDSLKNILEKTDKWISDTTNTGKGGGYSENRNILNEYEDVKYVLENICNSSINGVLGYGTDLQITTSWFTKTDEGGTCVEHIHCNSWYSGVVYFDEYGNDSSPIAFVRDFPPIFVDPVNPNFLNSNSLTIKPQHGMIILFPSDLRHKVLEHGSPSSRFALAFNVMPRGITGVGDSTYNYR